MSIVAGAVHNAAESIPIEIWEDIFVRLIWDPVLLEPRHNISHYYRSRGLAPLLRQCSTLRRVCRVWDIILRGLISITVSGAFLVPHHLQFRHFSLVDCEHLQLPQSPRLFTHFFTHRGGTITSLRLRINQNKDAKRWLVATSSLSALRCLSFHLGPDTSEDFLVHITQQWPNLRSLSYLHHSSRSWVADVEGIALLALDTLELSTPTLYNIGKWTLPSLKRLYAVMLSDNDFKLYSPLFRHGPRLVTLGISSICDLRPSISWEYLDSLTTLELDFYRCDLLLPLKFGKYGVQVDNSQLNFIKLVNTARENYDFWRTGIAEWVLGVYDDVPKQDKILAFADTWEDVRKSGFFEHLSAQAKYCARKGVRFEDLLERTLDEVGSTLGVAQEAGDNAHIEQMIPANLVDFLPSAVQYGFS
jgi:hypothetical protein